MKALVVYYSRTGTTRDLALELAQKLDCDIEEIIDKKSRKGILGWIHGGKDALKKSLTKIESKKNPKEYDIVIVGSPVWAGTISPAIRTYLDKHTLKRSAFFATSGTGKPQKAFIDMLQLTLSAKNVAKLCLSTKDVMSRSAEKTIDSFVEKIKDWIITI